MDLNASCTAISALVSMHLVVIRKNFKTYTKDQGCAEGIERILVYRYRIALHFANLNWSVDKSAESDREKPLEDFPELGFNNLSMLSIAILI